MQHSMPKSLQSGVLSLVRFPWHFVSHWPPWLLHLSSYGLQQILFLEPVHSLASAEFISYPLWQVLLHRPPKSAQSEFSCSVCALLKCMSTPNSKQQPNTTEMILFIVVRIEFLHWVQARFVINNWSCVMNAYTCNFFYILLL